MRPRFTLGCVWKNCGCRKPKFDSVKSRLWVLTIFLDLSPMSEWPSGLRRQTQGLHLVPLYGISGEFWSSHEGVGSNPTSDKQLLLEKGYNIQLNLEKHHSKQISEVDSESSYISLIILMAQDLDVQHALPCFKSSYFNFDYFESPKTIVFIF